MGRLLDAVASVDPTRGVCKLPQPFRAIDKLLSGIVDDAANVAIERELARLAARGIVEGTEVHDPIATFEDVGEVTCCASSEDGSRAFAGDDRGGVLVLDLATGATIHRAVAFGKATARWRAGDTYIAIVVRAAGAIDNG